MRLLGRVSPLVVAYALLVFSACVGEDPDIAGASDAATIGDGAAEADGGANGSDSSGDASVPPKRPCNPSDPFGAGRPIAGIANGGGLRLSPDELSAYVAGSDGQLYVASRTSLDEAFSPPTALSALNTGEIENGPTVTADGLMIVFQKSLTPADPNPNLFYAQRGSVILPFNSPQGLTPFNSASFEAAPYVRPDGKALYLIRVKGGGTVDFDIHSTTGSYAPDAAPSYAASTPVDAVNSTDTELSPVVTPDDLTLFWASNRTDGPLATKGSLDIYTATRADAGATFGSITKLDVLNTDATEAPSWISPDGCRLYFDRNTGAGSVPYRSERGVP